MHFSWIFPKLPSVTDVHEHDVHEHEAPRCQIMSLLSLLFVCRSLADYRLVGALRGILLELSCLLHEINPKR